MDTSPRTWYVLDNYWIAIMRLDLVFIYLISRFFYRLKTFLVHWYGHTFSFFKNGINSAPSFLYLPLLFLLGIIYIIWAVAPFYLLVRIFYMI